jgi:hypothetical protein
MIIRAQVAGSNRGRALNGSVADWRFNLGAGYGAEVSYFSNHHHINNNMKYQAFYIVEP